MSRYVDILFLFLEEVMIYGFVIVNKIYMLGEIMNSNICFMIIIFKLLYNL